MKLATALKLGRISNLPTVWTNVLAGAALTGSAFDCLTVATSAIAISLLYIAGMFLNDVFDLEWDRKHQPSRPLVAGEANVNEVTGLSVVFIVTAWVLVLFAATGGRIGLALLSALMLTGLIVLYDWKHKQWSVSPWIMGACRLMVYVTSAAIAGAWNWHVPAAGACLLAYIAAITYLARMEHLNTLNSYWPLILLLLPPGFVLYLGYNDIWSWLLAAVLLVWLIRAVRYLLPGKNRKVPQAIGALLAGIALIDTAILAALQQYLLAYIAAGAFALCLLLQRKVAPT
ncbi:MAG TPA: UbiA family prenyltransferase [Gammaproteobacteria bacterium]